ncbi:hypothetical protein NIES22_63670 [Calothrix brevissima NIES-22]|nr:hypothetical protein NIES22_63670 [Calothrix brevissima NIES-22]
MTACYNIFYAIHQQIYHPTPHNFLLVIREKISFNSQPSTVNCQRYFQVSPSWEKPKTKPENLSSLAPSS